MNYNEYLQLCLETALDIKAGNFDEGCGICSNLSDEVNRRVEEEVHYNSRQIMKQAFYTWPKFSGDEHYPIDDPRGIETAHNVYVQLPKWTGEYGALRFELLDHVIDFLKKEIEKESIV